jgi:hypothetical protein
MKVMTGLILTVVTGTLLVCFGPVAPARAYPPDPNNAALLYYQTFLLFNAPTSQEFASFVKGTTGPTDEIREYVQKGRTAIKYALMATERQQCDWGIVYSKGFLAVFPYLAQCRQLGFLLLADARLLAADGDCRAALERCLSTKRLAHHVGAETIIAFLVQHAIDGLADDCIRDVLGMAPPDLQTVEWLKGQWAAASAPEASLALGLEYEQEMCLKMMQMDRLAELKEALQGNENEPTAPRLPGQIDEAFLARNREYYTRYMTTMQATLARPISYAQKWLALKTMQDRMTQEAGRRTDDIVTAAVAPALGKVYTIDVKAQARANALRVGLELLTLKAQTGKLPETLPANMAQDPFSGQDFLYQKTPAGFLLRCQGKDLDKDQVYEWEFKVR